MAGSEPDAARGPVPRSSFARWRDPTVAGPLDGFIHDVEFTSFDSRLGRWVPLALAAAVAVVAAQLGVTAAYALAVLSGVGLALAVIVRERDRWRSQDVVHWFFLDRRERWQRDTGRPSPDGDPAAAEIWLGVHRPGSVPPIYRVIAATWTGDEATVARELAAMPEATIDEIALKRWVIEAQRWAATGHAETTEIGSLVDRIANPADRSMVRSWLAMVESARRWTARDRDWLAPLVAERTRASRRRLGLRRSARLWLSRFIVIPAFLISSAFLTPLALAISDPARQVPPEYAETSIYTRGDLREVDPNRIWIALPRIAAALPTASKVDPRPLDEDGIDLAVADGLPTLTWEIGTVDVAGPTDAAGRHVWSVEVLLGEGGAPADRHAIITFDREDGPALLYRIDGSVADALRAAVDLGP